MEFALICGLHFLSHANILWLFAEKNYGYTLFNDPEEWEEEMQEYRARQETEALFRSGAESFGL